MPTSPVARAVAARRLFLPLCQLGAGSCRASSSRAACAPLSPRDITSLLGLCDAHTPRHSPRSCRPSVPTSPLPPAPLLRVGSSCPFASSAPAPAACRARAPLARLCHPVTSPRCSASVMLTHHAAARDRADLPCRRRCCRPRRRRASKLRTPCERGAGSRRAPSERTACAPHPPPWHRLATRALLDAHHRATARSRVGLPRRPRRRRPRCRSAATLLAPLHASAPAHAAHRARAPLARLCHPRDLTSLLGLCDAHTPRHSPRSCRPFVPTLPLPPAPSVRVDASYPLASSAPAHAACRASAPRARFCHPRDITSSLELSLTPITAPQPRIVSAFRADAAAAARAVAARRRFVPLRELGAGSRRAPSSAPLARLCHPRDITSLPGLRSAHTPRRSPRSCRPSVSTPPLPPAPSSRVDVSCPLRARRRLAPRTEPARRLRASVTPVTPLAAGPLRRPHPAPQPDLVSTFRADAAAAARAVAARRRFLPPGNLGAGSRRAPS